MEIRVASARAKLRQSNWNDKQTEITLVLNGTFVRRASDLEKTANMNFLPYSHSLTRSTDVFLYKGNIWAHDQLFALWRKTKPKFTREHPMHPPKVHPGTNFIVMHGLECKQFWVLWIRNVMYKNCTTTLSQI